ncbi:MAG TPA: hypothetical protein EYP74_00835 [Anaerolineales bacterium]|nr:hypothetical protein [Anaerolineales bacterium]
MFEKVGCLSWAVLYIKTGAIFMGLAQSMHTDIVMKLYNRIEYRTGFFIRIEKKSKMLSLPSTICAL